MSNIKLSTALIRGYKKVNGQQCFGAFQGLDGKKRVALCHAGAANVGYGLPFDTTEWPIESRRIRALEAFKKAYGIESDPHGNFLPDLNDGSIDGENDDRGRSIPPEDLIGMLLAIGE